MFIIKKKISKLIIAGLSAIILSAAILPVAVTYAEAKDDIEEKTIEVGEHTKDDLVLTDDLFSVEDIEFLNKVAAIGEHFYLDENENSQTNLSVKDLVDHYDFSTKEANLLLNGLAGQETEVPLGIDENSSISPAAHFEGGRLYISNFDLQSGAFAAVAVAATSGTAALKAAFIAAATVVSGPVGTFISTIMAVVGGPGLIDLGAHIVTALAVGEGVWVGVQTRYPFIDVGYWNG